MSRVKFVPTELFNIGSRQQFVNGDLCILYLATKFLDARAKVRHLLFCSFQLVNGSRLFLDYPYHEAMNGGISIVQA